MELNNLVLVYQYKSRLISQNESFRELIQKIRSLQNPNELELFSILSHYQKPIILQSKEEQLSGNIDLEKGVVIYKNGRIELCLFKTDRICSKNQIISEHKFTIHVVLNSKNKMKIILYLEKPTQHPNQHICLS